MRHFHIREWGINKTEIQESSTSMEFLRASDIVHVEISLLRDPTYNQIRDTIPSGPIWIWRYPVPHLSVLLWPIYRVTPKAVSFAWNPEQEKALQQFQAAVPAALPLGPYDKTDLVVQYMSVTDVDSMFRDLASPYGWIMEQTFRILEQSPVVTCR